MIALKLLYNKVRRAKQTIFASSFLLITCSFAASCGDMLEQDSNKLVFTEKATLTDATDTIYSVTGIINKMQAIADRTILLGEVRGDLIDINNNTSSDLRDVALFQMQSDNKYNSLRDYYAVINNCNYFIANADTALRNQRKEYIFKKEYAAVKAFRAWTYLQMALNYGEVEFVTTPILTKEESEKTYPTKDIQGICDYFIQDLAGLENIETPGYGTIRNTDSHLFYFPIYILLGDLNLWAGNYKEAALDYYRYLSHRDNVNNAVTPITTNAVMWMSSDAHWQNITDSWSLSSFSTEKSGNELITMIPGDSIPSEGNYSQLRNLFNTTSGNDYKESLDPSERIQEISEDQTYCFVNSGYEISYAPDGLENHHTGDLRLSSVWNTASLGGMSLVVDGKKVDNYSSIDKYSTRNVHLYRLAMVYLRMAEALNRAGYPRFAFSILSTGVNNSVISENVIPYYSEADSAWISQFDFPNTKYVIQTKAGMANMSSTENTMGLHSRGSGFTAGNEHYLYPAASTLAEEEEKVEDLIMQEEALEFAFEGHRFYDLMRIALRRNDPSYLADRVYMRKGIDHVTDMKAAIAVDLNNKSNWYLKK